MTNGIYDGVDDDDDDDGDDDDNVKSVKLLILETIGGRGRRGINWTS